MADNERRANDPLILEMHSDVKILIGEVREIKTAQVFYCKDVEKLESRILKLELLPEKRLSQRSLKVGIMTAIIGVPLTLIGLVLTFVLK
jgi:hypothetical protein